MTATTDEAFSARVPDSFAQQSLMATFGPVLDEIAPGRVVISAPIPDLVRLTYCAVARAAIASNFASSSAAAAARSAPPSST